MRRRGVITTTVPRPGFTATRRRFVDAALIASGDGPAVRFRGSCTPPLRLVVSVVGAGILGVCLLSYFVVGVLVGTVLGGARLQLAGPLLNCELELDAGLYVAGVTYGLEVRA